MCGTGQTKVGCTDDGWDIVGSPNGIDEGQHSTLISYTVGLQERLELGVHEK